MKRILLSSIGLVAFLIGIPVSFGAYCTPTGTSTYAKIYCDISQKDNEEVDDDVFKTIAEQLGYDVMITDPGALVKWIIDEDISLSSAKLDQFIEDKNLDFDELPVDVRDAWFDNRKWDGVLTKVKTSFGKEKVLYHTKKSLEYELKASEKYWDGQLLDTMDAPFDLIVDLNLIEGVLFGSGAEWMTNPFQFNEEEDEGGEEGGGGTGGSTEAPEPSSGTTYGTPSEDEGMTIEETVTPGEEGGDCVPADDPDADAGDTPGTDPGSKPNCGNGKVDILFGEECDDGNTKSGDGCSQYCMNESTGADQMCSDPEAVTFSAPSNNQTDGQSGSQSGQQSGQQSDGQSDCPPGTFPKKETTVTGPPSTEPDYPEAPQSDNYPGPNVGGTMKEFPESNRPPCPEGYSELQSDGGEVSAGGGEEFGVTVAGESKGHICIPTEFCADFDAARDFLFGADWQDDENKAQIATSIEAMFCVNIVKANRPESPYLLDEGCVDCHITAIVDALEEALETNVTPLQNTTSGFGISNRWGPKFSFNLTTTVKGKFMSLLGRDPSKDIEKTDSDIEKIKKKYENPTLSVSATQTAAQIIGDEEQKQSLIRDEIKNYKISNMAIRDQELAKRVTPLLQQMSDSFLTLSSDISGLIDGISVAGDEIDKKQACPCQ